MEFVFFVVLLSIVPMVWMKWVTLFGQVYGIIASKINLLHLIYIWKRKSKKIAIIRRF